MMGRVYVLLNIKFRAMPRKVFDTKVMAAIGYLRCFSTINEKKSNYFLRQEESKFRLVKYPNCLKNFFASIFFKMSIVPR